MTKSEIIKLQRERKAFFDSLDLTNQDDFNILLQEIRKYKNFHFHDRNGNPIINGEIVIPD